MKTSIHARIRRVAAMLWATAAAAGFTACATPSHIDPAARALAESISSKLATARTVRVTANHRLDPALGVGARHESGPLEITVKRPNRFYALQRAGTETREIAYDGTSLCLMHPRLMHHALEPLAAGSVEEFADRMDDRFGFRPPVAELLTNDAAAQLFRDATSARVTGIEPVGPTPCQRMHIVQEGMTGDLWVGVSDQLPRRLLLTFTDLPGRPGWDIHLSKWELNVPVDDRLFSKRPAAGSQKVTMLKSE